MHPDLPSRYGGTVVQGPVGAEDVVFPDHPETPLERDEEVEVRVVQEHLFRRSVLEPPVGDDYPTCSWLVSTKSLNTVLSVRLPG